MIYCEWKHGNVSVSFSTGDIQIRSMNDRHWSDEPAAVSECLQADNGGALF